MPAVYSDNCILEPTVQVLHANSRHDGTFSSSEVPSLRGPVIWWSLLGH